MQFSKVSGTKNQHKVILYALSTCVWCKMTKQFLNDNNVEYEYLDVDLLEETEKQKVKKELVEKTKSMGFPMVMVDDKDVVTGFKKDKLRETLGL